MSEGKKIGEWLAGGEPIKQPKPKAPERPIVNISNVDAAILDYVVQTQCSFAGKTMMDVIKAPTGVAWMRAALSDDAKRAKLHAEDIVNFSQVLDAVQEG